MNKIYKIVFWISWYFIYFKFEEKINKTVLPYLKMFFIGIFILSIVEVFLETTFGMKIKLLR